MKTCSRCGVPKPLDDFYRHERRRDGHRSECKECTKSDQRGPGGTAIRRKYQAANREKLIADGRGRYAANREQFAERWSRYSEAHREELAEAQRRRREADPDRAKEISQRSYRKNQQQRLDQAKERWQDIRDRIFEHYGTVCVCCGSTQLLTIDHIDGNGREHRQSVTNGYNIYMWLIRSNFPAGFQTLCRPCNSSKGRGSSCQLNHAVMRPVA